MAAITISSDFGAQKLKSDTVSTVHLFPMNWWDQMPWSSFPECWALSQLFHSPLSLSTRGLLVPLLFLPPILPNIRDFTNESTFPKRRPKYWSFSFSISPTKEHPGLISFRMDGLDFLAVQETPKSSPTPQFKSISSSVLSFLHSPTLTSIHDYWKTIALTRQTFVGQVMSLLSKMLSRLVITFLPRSKRLLISWLQSPSAENWSPKK